jgi:hypothetical protein
MNINNSNTPEPTFVRVVDGIPCITLVEHHHLLKLAARQPWVGLTTQEKRLTLLLDDYERVLDYEDYADAIEAKLKEKNT